MRRLRQLTLLVVVALAVSAVLAATALASTFDLRANLAHGTLFPRAGGYAEYQSSSHREFDVHVWHVPGLAGQRVGVFLNGVKIGSMTVRSSGSAEFDVSTEYGQAVPYVRAGDRVAVRSHGAVVARGWFVRVPS